MLFVACRLGDVMQAFIGLWLVPKYVGPEELGAVLPLQQLAGFFTVPLAIIGIVFSKYVNTYATRGERGKVKSFIWDVIRMACVVFMLCIVGAYLLIPHFYSRLNVGAGSLTILVLAAGFTSNFGGLFGSALQGLKKFKTMTVLNLLTAPIRLVTLLIAMPFRPLSGYMLGQTTPAATGGILSALAIHRDLKDVTLDTTWRKDLPEIWRYLWPIAVYTAVSTLTAVISNTVYRQRLPEVESAAYYMLSRFSDIASYIGCSLLIVLVPLASEAHESGKDDTQLLTKSILLNLIFTIFITLIFTFSAEFIFSLNEQWRNYQPFAHLLPLLTIIIGIAQIPASIISYEMACRRFTLPFLFACYHFVATALFVALSGIEFFRGKLPNSFVDNISSLKFNTLSHFSWYAFGVTLLGVVLCVFTSYSGKRKRTKSLLN